MSTMILSVLIVGKTSLDRHQEAEKTAKEVSSVFDIRFIDSQVQGGIDSVRNLKRELSRKPFNSKKQTAIIFESQNLTLQAQNALLKEIEEPNPHTQIILTAPSKFSLVPTLVSRVQIIDLGADLFEEVPVETEELARKMAAEGTGERILLGEGVEFEQWFFLWHKFLHQKLTDDYSLFPFLERINLERVCKYIKVLQDLNIKLEGNANKKLVQLILTTAAPF